jgi:hypothetical protein
MKKNLYLLPTDKPSRLIIYSTLLNEFRLLAEPIEDWKHKRNVYVTSDEEPKAGDYVLDDEQDVFQVLEINHTQGILRSDGFTHVIAICKKIILTTDDELIKDGVQAIDDEFLEWFVRNPSCEKVEVNSIPRCCGRCNGIDDLCFTDMTCDDHKERGCEICYGKMVEYFIIIPKEEPNREITFEKVFGEEKKKDLKEFIDKHKKETLDEAVERLFNYHSNNTSLAEGHYDYMMDKEDFKQASYELVKWQHEQDKNKFSAEEVRRIAEWSFHFYKTNEFDDDELEAEWSRILDNNLKKK